MTFDEVMKKYNGEWSNGRAVIQAQGGYYWCVATGSPEKYELTSDGKRYVSDFASPDAVEPAQSPAAEEKPKRGRKPAAILNSSAG